MKKLIMAMAGLALPAGMATADARPLHKDRAHGPLIQRDVSLPMATATGGANAEFKTGGANAEFKYGPQPDYPQSPAGGGY
jgi:hypothetical protein